MSKDFEFVERKLFDTRNIFQKLKSLIVKGQFYRYNYAEFVIENKYGAFFKQLKRRENIRDMYDCYGAHYWETKVVDVKRIKNKPGFVSVKLNFKCKTSDTNIVPYNGYKYLSVYNLSDMNKWTKPKWRDIKI